MQFANGAPKVSEAARSAIRPAMRALNNHPDITNLFYPQVIRGIEDAALSAGYDLSRVRVLSS